MYVLFDLIVVPYSGSKGPRRTYATMQWIETSKDEMGGRLLCIGRATSLVSTVD